VVTDEELALMDELEFVDPFADRREELEELQGQSTSDWIAPWHSHRSAVWERLPLQALAFHAFARVGQQAGGRVHLIGTQRQGSGGDCHDDRSR
jgi:hypothetical protein